MQRHQKQVYPEMQVPQGTESTTSPVNDDSKLGSSTEGSELATLRLMILQRDFLLQSCYQTIYQLQSQIRVLTGSNPPFLGASVGQQQSLVPTFNAVPQQNPIRYNPCNTNFTIPSTIPGAQATRFNTMTPPQSPNSESSHNVSSDFCASEESSLNSSPESKLFGGKFSEYISNLKTVCPECSSHGRLKSKKKPLVDSLLLLAFFEDGVHRTEQGGYFIEDENATREKMNSISVLIRPPSRGTNHSYENWKRAMGKTFRKDGNTFTPKDEETRRYVNHVEEHLQKISTAKKLAEVSMMMEQ